jgi:pimeloyl-ACP methyl ester carboxylesterase
MTWFPSIPVGRLPRLRMLRLAGTVALLGPLAISTFYGKAQTPMSQPQDVRNIVLVHGAWADGSSWNKIIPLLQRRGFHVTAVHLPFTTLAEDAATVKRTLALQEGPVLLVGHSYGGAVITEAGDDPNVAGLVYVAAFAPDLGQSAGDLNNQYPPPSGGKEIRSDANGFLQLTDKGVSEDFAPDLTTPEKQIIAAIQGQVSGPNEGKNILASPTGEG